MGVGDAISDVGAASNQSSSAEDAASQLPPAGSSSVAPEDENVTGSSFTPEQIAELRSIMSSFPIIPVSAAPALQNAAGMNLTPEQVEQFLEQVERVNVALASSPIQDGPPESN